MKEALQNIRQSADALIAQAADAAAVDELRVRFPVSYTHLCLTECLIRCDTACYGKFIDPVFFCRMNGMLY